MAAAQPSTHAVGSYLTARPLILSMFKLLLVGVAQVPLARAYPASLWTPYTSLAEEADPMSSDDPTLWIYLAVAIGLVLLGGAFAGLTIALMGQVRCINTPSIAGAKHG